VTVEAIAQGGSGQASLDQGVFFGAISTALPDKVYAMTLIGGASNVADALLGAGDEIFGTAILEGSSVSATFDFSFRGDLILGEVDNNSVINLGFFSGPVDLTLEDFGIMYRSRVRPALSPCLMRAPFRSGGRWRAGWRRSPVQTSGAKLKSRSAPPRLGSHRRVAGHRAASCGWRRGSPSWRPFRACRRFLDRP
jgi:hypothetical protein